MSGGRYGLRGSVDGVMYVSIGNPMSSDEKANTEDATTPEDYPSDLGDTPNTPPIIPDFDSLPKAEQADWVIRALVDNPDYPLGYILGRYGISQETYTRVAVEPGFKDNLIKYSLAAHMMPHLPTVIKNVSEGAADGSETKIKHFMTLAGLANPDTQINVVNFANESMDSLRNRTKYLMQQLQELEKDDTIPAIDVEAEEIIDEKEKKDGD